MKAKRTPETEADFARDGIFFLEEQKLENIKVDAGVVTLDVELATMAEANVPDFSVMAKSPRGVATYITDWKITEPNADGIRILSFKASIPVPFTMIPASAGFTSRTLAMTFLDFCYYSGCEKISEDYKPLDCATPLRSGAQYADIGWVLPSRFVDQVIDALSKVDNAMLGGALEEAILYWENN